MSNYSGHARISRLLFIADRSVGNPLELEALKLAADTLKQVLGAQLCTCCRTKEQTRQGAWLAETPIGAIPLPSAWHHITQPDRQHACLRALPPPFGLLQQTEDTQRYAEVIERINGRAGPQYALDRCGGTWQVQCCGIGSLFLPCCHFGPPVRTSAARGSPLPLPSLAGQSMHAGSLVLAHRAPHLVVAHAAVSGWSELSKRRSSTASGWSRVRRCPLISQWPLPACNLSTCSADKHPEAKEMSHIRGPASARLHLMCPLGCPHVPLLCRTGCVQEQSGEGKHSHGPQPAG